MNDQYFTADPHSASRPTECAFAYRGAQLRFETDSGVFSRGELDEGSRILLDALPEVRGTALDLGCGWGAVGIALAAANAGADVTMADVNRRALSLAEKNAERNRVACRTVESDGFSALQRDEFDFIVTNPPIRAGKQVIYRLFAECAQHLKEGGALYLVIRKQQGAESAMRYLQTLFGQVERVSREKGFWVLKAMQPLEKETE